jgi:glucoside 3-dehydrogenase (cytochrome c) hitch-hiker subunit
MQRRDLLRLLGTGALLPFLPRSLDAAVRFGQAAHAAAALDGLEILSPEQAELVSTLADLILPRTDTPGASDVGVTGFVDHLLAAWYHADEREQFLAGLADIDARAGGRFTSLETAAQTRLVGLLDGAEGEAGSAESEFGRLKSLTIYGYFTSERVVKEVTREPLIPGRFDGCVSSSERPL